MPKKDEPLRLPTREEIASSQAEFTKRRHRMKPSEVDQFERILHTATVALDLTERVKALEGALSDANRVARAIRAYAGDRPDPRTKSDLLAIVGYPHYHIAGTTKGYAADMCALCLNDLRSVVHSSAAIEAAQTIVNKMSLARPTETEKKPL